MHTSINTASSTRHNEHPTMSTCRKSTSQPLHINTDNNYTTRHSDFTTSDGDEGGWRQVELETHTRLEPQVHFFIPSFFLLIQIDYTSEGNNTMSPLHATHHDTHDLPPLACKRDVRVLLFLFLSLRCRITTTMMHQHVSTRMICR